MGPGEQVEGGNHCRKVDQYRRVHASPRAQKGRGAIGFGGHASMVVQILLAAGTFGAFAALQAVDGTGEAMISDEALMLEFQRGSRAAFEEIFARHRDALHGFFRRRLTDAAQADDLTQETFLAVLRGAARYEPRALVRTYLYGIALKLLFAARRKRAAEPFGADVASAPEPDDSLWVRQALARLEAEEREILMLREYEQLSYAEIAELLRIPVNTVRSRLFRSRMALKSYLEPEVKHA
jgi:RNA polymerase sigma-70 factor (ECF subfamily)